MNRTVLLDCTLRDGGYYTAWDFEPALVKSYINAMVFLPADVVEVGFRQFSKASHSFLGAAAYSKDTYVRSLEVPEGGPLVAVMVNASDLIQHPAGVTSAVQSLFGVSDDSPVDIVRLACHASQVEDVLPAVRVLDEAGYTTTVNLMQIGQLEPDEVLRLAALCNESPLAVLYFADSLGGMSSEDVTNTVGLLREVWGGEIGFHAHNNMERALANSMSALEAGVTWLDSTVLGVGRGAGNAQTEYLALELETVTNRRVNMLPLLDTIERHLSPLQREHGWGANVYYYLAGKHGIHPTYVQEMTADARYDSEDMLAVMKHLELIGGRHYNLESLQSGRNFYAGEPHGSWCPADVMEDREVLILGAGPGVARYRDEIERFIRDAHPYVIALNTRCDIAAELIDAHAASHPVRLLADCDEYVRLRQPLITPYSSLPDEIVQALGRKVVYDYGIGIKPETFAFGETYGVTPSPLVIAYVLAAATSGGASRILLVGFDGYGRGDVRTEESQELLDLYKATAGSLEVIALTPTIYSLPIESIYGS